MTRIPHIQRFLFLALLALQTLHAQQPKPPQQDLFPGFSATRTDTAFPGVPATPTNAAFPGVLPTPNATRPLAGAPSVIGLQHLEPPQMTDSDNELVSNLRAELSKEAALAGFDISQPAWHYQQAVCPVLPDYVWLAFTHGPDTEGSSRFMAILPRDSAQVRIVSTYGHGFLPFESSWSRPGSFAVFNAMLRRELGHRSPGYAPNWLPIGMCYAELSGYPVQVLSTLPLPDPTLDLLRLDANQPQMLIDPNQGADVTFSDVSKPTTTTNWTLHFNRQGELTSAGRVLSRQGPTIALKP